MTIHLVTYHPLNSTPVGQEAVKKHSYPPYVDGSARREPDLQSNSPLVSSICRGAYFAPRIKVADTLVYITCLDRKEDQWRITAILDVCERFETHEDAEVWYREQELPVPTNCIVVQPLELDHTRICGTCVGKNDDDTGEQRYQKRARDYPMMLRCIPQYPVELHNPPVLTRQDMDKIFGGVPYTRNPPSITQEQLEALIRIFRRDIQS